MIDMASKQILPAVVSYTKELADTVLAVAQTGIEPVVQKELLEQVNLSLKEMQKALKELQEAENKVTEITNAKEKAFFYREVVTAAMKKLREPADRLEVLVDKRVWPFPTYGDLLFEV